MSQFAPFGTLFRYFALRFVGWITLCLLEPRLDYQPDSNGRTCPPRKRFNIFPARYQFPQNGAVKLASGH